MPKSKTKTQRVQAYVGPDTVEQIATYDPLKDWINVSHDGTEISMKLENWDALVKLVNGTVFESKNSLDA